MEILLERKNCKLGLFGSGTTADAKIKVGYNGKEAEKGLGSLKKVVAGVITFVVLKKMAEYTLELAKLGAQAQLVEKNFKKMASDQGRNVADMMSSLRSATLGMVNDMQLQQSAMKALISGIDFDDLLVAMEYVTKFALSTGDSVSTRMQTVLTGLARGSALMLDDVGIQIKGTQNIVGRAIDQMKEKMNIFADSEGEAAIEAAKLKSEFENLKIAIGQRLVPVYNQLIKVAVEAGKKMKLIFDPEELTASKEIEAIGKRILELQQKIKIFGKTLSGERRKDVENDIKFLEEMRKSFTEKEAKKTGVAEEERIRLAALKKRTEDAIKSGEEIVKVREKKAKEAELIAKEAAEEMEKLQEGFLAEQLRLREEFHTESLRKEKEFKQEGVDLELEIEADRKATIEQLQGEIILTEKEIYDERMRQLTQFHKDGLLNDTDYLTLVMQAQDEFRESDLAKTAEYLAEKEAMWRNNMAVTMGVTNALMSFSSTYTEFELNEARKQSKNSEEYQKKQAEIMHRAAQRQYAFALWQQGLDVADAVRNAASAIIKAGEHGASYGVVGAILEAGLAGAEFAVMLANLAQAPQPPPPNMAMGGLAGKRQRTRQPDNINTMIGDGEYISDAPTTNKYYNELESMRAGTFDKKKGGASSTYNIYGVSNEQFLQLTIANERQNKTGMRL